jgi:hypothetical protein
MLLCYLKCKVLIIICIGYHKIDVTYSCIKYKCIGKELDLKVSGFMCYGVLHIRDIKLGQEGALSRPRCSGPSDHPPCKF